MVSLTFDDGDADQIAVARILAAYGMRGTFYIITGAIGTNGYMTRDDLRELAADRDEIGAHTVSHLSLPRVPLAEVRRQVCDSRNILAGWGFRVTSFAYPDATYTAAIETVVRECGFSGARIGNGIRNGLCPGCAAAETIPPADPFAIRTPGQIDITWTLRSMEQVVVSAERRGGWVPFIFHHVCADPDSSSCGNLSISPDTFANFTRWLAARTSRGTIVRTVGDVLGGSPRPLVTVRAAAAHGVVNSRLTMFGTSAAVSAATETTSGASSPNCWLEGGYGQNAVRWQRIAGGHGGGSAEQVTMTSHANGDAKLLQQFDLGQCSLPVKPGRIYVLGAWYKSTGHTQFSVYYRDSSGRWAYWTSSPYFSGTAQWAHATWTAPPVPSGASAISFGLDIFAVGTLTTADYSFHAASSAGEQVLIVLVAAIAGLGAARGLYVNRAGLGRLVAGGWLGQIAGAWRSRSSSSSSSPKRTAKDAASSRE